MRRDGVRSGEKPLQNEDLIMNPTVSHASNISSEQLDISAEKSMRTHVPAIDRFLRDRGIVYVRSEYLGADGRGEFERLQFQRADGALCMMADSDIHQRLEATFRTLLFARYPHWCLGDGSGGDFRWNLTANVLTHTHYFRGIAVERSTHHNL